jgi:hypothetical protein
MGQKTLQLLRQPLDLLRPRTHGIPGVGAEVKEEAEVMARAMPPTPHGTRQNSWRIKDMAVATFDTVVQVTVIFQAMA